MCVGVNLWQRFHSDNWHQLAFWRQIGSKTFAELVSMEQVSSLRGWTVHSCERPELQQLTVSHDKSLLTVAGLCEKQLSQPLILATGNKKAEHH